MKSLLPILVAIVTFSCSPVPSVPFAGEPDLSPPEVVMLELTTAYSLTVTFSEPIIQVDSEILASDELGAITSTVDGSDTAVFSFENAADPGAESFVEAQVEDAAGNNLRFVARFYGMNDRLPELLINEVTTQGSGNHPDIVEIIAVTDGDLAGATIYEGVPENWEQRLILPSLQVSAGDFIVVHFRPDGSPEEIDELESQSASGGKNATDSAWDFWVPEGSGLSGNNGVISITQNPLGGYLDVFVYSNRTSASDENYRGFGSGDVMDRADSVTAAGMWVAAGDQVAPEDAVDPEDSTATRSMSRSSTSGDTNSKSDWHITPTSGISPGAVNTDEVYQP